MDVVNRWRASNFEREAVEAALAKDVEWVVPRHGGTTLRGIDAVLEWYGGGAAAEEASEDLGGAEPCFLPAFSSWERPSFTDADLLFAPIPVAVYG
jgi:hypothetical protein